MKTVNWVLLGITLLVGIYVGSMRPVADAQTIPNAVSSPRYQISALAYAGNPSQPTPKEGYYILDTITGELWQSDSSGKPAKVSSKLP